MEKSNYWSRTFDHRVSRRAMLRGAGVGAAGLAGAALIGCGDDDDDDGGGGGGGGPTAPGATTAPQDDGPISGGVYRYFITGDPPTLDPYGNLSYLTKGYADHVYSRLFELKSAPGLPGAANLPGPDLAESAEVSLNGTEWIIKLRPNAKFQNLAPVDGRQVTSDDVLYSWSRMTAPETENRGQVSFVENVEAIDDTTVKFTLNKVSAVFLDMLSDCNLLWILPTEAEGGFGGFDVQMNSVGSGPWIIDDFRPDVGQQYVRNPDWHFGPERPYLDGIHRIIPEPTNKIAQMQAGNIDFAEPPSDDVLTLKNDPRFSHWNWFTGDPGSTLNALMFSDINDQSVPWNDERVRQATSMSLDRAAKLDFEYNVDNFKEAGLNPSEAWHNLIPVGQSRFWLDPTSADMGPSAQYFQYDVAEAKKLMAAANQGDGFDIPFIYNTNRYGGRFGHIQEVNLAYLDAIGITGKLEIQDYSSVYITQTFAGEFKGLISAWETPFPEPGGYPKRMFNVDDRFNHSRVNDPEIWDLTLRQDTELDFETRRELMWEIQRLNAKHMYYIPMTFGGGTRFGAAQPWLNNIGIYRTRGCGSPSETHTYYWIDPKVKEEFS